MAFFHADWGIFSFLGVGNPAARSQALPQVKKETACATTPWRCATKISAPSISSPSLPATQFSEGKMHSFELIFFALGIEEELGSPYAAGVLQS